MVEGRHALWVLVAAVSVLLGSHTATAGEHPDFSGVWELDLDAPAADTVEVTQTITQTDNNLTIKVEGGGQTKTEVLDLTGKVQVRNTENAGRVETRSFWSDDGQTIITVSKYKTPDGKQAVWTTRRSLGGNGKVIIVDHEVKIEGGETLKAKRIVRKKS